MARNVEIKARVADLAALEEAVASIATEGPVDIAQVDTFFRVPTGRLKLRDFGDGTGELIQYDRPDSPEPRASDYARYPTAAPVALGEALAQGLGVRGVVRKHRRLYLVDRTRVHLDRVEGLGTFLELEVVLRDGESVDDGTRVAQGLMSDLAIECDDLIDRAYVDLLDEAPPSP